MNTNNKKEWEKVVSRAHMDINGHCPLAEDEAIIEADKQIKQLEQERDALKANCEEMKELIGRLSAGLDPFYRNVCNKMYLKTPTQSLEEIQNSTIETMIDSIMDWSNDISP